MATVTLKGTPFPLIGDLPTSGTAADFSFVKSDLSEGKMSDYEGKVKVLIAVPSLDTGVCQMETRKFNEELSKRDGAVGLILSKDLPFAMNRFCEAEGIKNVTIASDFRFGQFTKAYNTEVAEGPFGGLSARAVFVVDANNQIQYTELVTEIADQPNYDAVMKAVDGLL
ncbi:MAG: thiol peroxidase [Bacteroidia bacterium]|nr:thiol peroxidase [Bacteroidia bacterium]